MGDRDAGATDFVAAFTLGALFGVGLALFLAPQSGEKTRKKLGKKSKQWKKDAGKRVDEVGGRAREVGEEWLEDAEEIAAEVSEEIAAAVRESVELIRRTTAEEIEKLTENLGRKRKKGLFR